jgi:NarL family two-component system response regulator LiaR
LIRVLVVDDHEVVRRGLRLVLEQEDGIEVVGECADGARALVAIPALRPDVVLLDMVMPGIDGLGVLRGLRGGPAVIVLASFLEDEHVIEAIRLGALSYLSKTTPADEVVAAVRAAAEGGSVLAAGTAALLVERVRRGRRSNPLDLLTPRELQVLTELTRGRSNAEICRSLALGRETVKTHVSRILNKLGLTDRTQAAIFGLQQGLIPLDEALGD